MSVAARIFGALLLCTGLSAQTRPGISAAGWGTTARGEKVAIYTLAGAGGLEARISDFGGVIVALQRQCHPHDNGQGWQAVWQSLRHEFRDPALPRLAESARIPVNRGDAVNAAA